MLIVSKTDGCSTNFTDEINILNVMLGKKRVSNAPSVLMTRHSAKRVFLSVKDKAVIGIYLKAAATEPAANVIKNLSTLNYLHLTAV